MRFQITEISFPKLTEMGKYIHEDSIPLGECPDCYDLGFFCFPDKSRS